MASTPLAHSANAIAPILRPTVRRRRSRVARSPTSCRDILLPVSLGMWVLGLRNIDIGVLRGPMVYPETYRRASSRLPTCEEVEFCIRATRDRPELVWIYQPSASVLHLVPHYRTAFRYFLDRSWLAEKGKASLAGITGRSAALSAERAYTFKVLPAGVARAMSDGVLDRDLAAFGRRRRHRRRTCRYHRELLAPPEKGVSRRRRGRPTAGTGGPGPGPPAA